MQDAETGPVNSACLCKALEPVASEAAADSLLPDDFEYWPWIFGRNAPPVYSHWGRFADSLQACPDKSENSQKKLAWHTAAVQFVNATFKDRHKSNLRDRQPLMDAHPCLFTKSATIQDGAQDQAPRKPLFFNDPHAAGWVKTPRLAHKLGVVRSD